MKAHYYMYEETTFGIAKRGLVNVAIEDLAKWIDERKNFLADVYQYTRFEDTLSCAKGEPGEVVTLYAKRDEHRSERTHRLLTERDITYYFRIDY